MPNTQTRVLHVSDKRYLLRWVIARMEEASPSVAILPELSQQCDLFIEQLVNESRLVLIPVSRNCISRSMALAWKMPKKCVGRSQSILDFLGSLGHVSEKAQYPIKFSIDDVLVCAIKSWSQSADFVHWKARHGTYTITSNERVLLRCGLFFDVELTPRDGWYQFTRAMKYPLFDYT